MNNDDTDSLAGFYDNPIPDLQNMNLGDDLSDLLGIPTAGYSDPLGEMPVEFDVPENPALLSSKNITNVFGRKSPKKKARGPSPIPPSIPPSIPLEPTYDNFFEKLSFYLQNNPVKFDSAMEKKMLYTTLQTLERVRKNDNLLKLYIENEKIKVNNTAKMPENRYRFGAQKRLQKPITRRSTKMPKEKFDKVYDEMEELVFPIYKMLSENSNIINNETFVQNAKQKVPSLESKSNKYIASIYDDYIERKSEVIDMLKNKTFQVGTEGKYLWDNQIRRYHAFKKDKPRDEFLDEKGSRYKDKIQAVFNNMKSFILGGDDDIWREWYISHKAEDKYQKLKAQWNQFISDNQIYIKFNTYLDQSIIINGIVTPLEKPLEDFARERSNNEDVKKVQKKLYDIYREDTEVFKGYLFSNTKYNSNNFFTNDLSRYEIMNAKKDDVQAILKHALVDDDTIRRVISKIDFLRYPKKANRSRSIRVIPTNKDTVGTPIDGIVKTKTRATSPKKK